MSGIYTDRELRQAAMNLAEEIYRITKTFPSQVNLANLTLILNRRSLFSAPPPGLASFSTGYSALRRPPKNQVDRGPV
jgi:hypothetical protein